MLTAYAHPTLGPDWYAPDEPERVTSGLPLATVEARMLAARADGLTIADAVAVGVIAPEDVADVSSWPVEVES